MTTLEIDRKKDNLIRFITNIDNEEVLNELLEMINSLVVKFPCQHSEEEIIKSAEEAIKAFEAGEGIPHEVIKNRFSA